MKVIDFNQRDCKKIEKLTDPSDYLIVGDWELSCTNCKNSMIVSSDHAIIKTIEIFCSNCGSKYKLSNPALSQKIIKKDSK